MSTMNKKTILTMRWAYWLSIGMGVFHIVWMGIVKFLILFVYTAVFMALASIMRKTFLNMTQGATETTPIVVMLGVFIDVVCIAALVVNTMAISIAGKGDRLYRNRINEA